MSRTVDAFLHSWPFEPWLCAALLLTAAVYTRGWCALRCRDVGRWSLWRYGAFVMGLLVIFVALASPIEPFTPLLLQVHMLQHILLMMIAPPLLWLGAPLFPLLLGSPLPVRRYWAAPIFRLPLLRHVFERLTHPLSAWLLFVMVTVGWHVPPIYALALRSSTWHYFQHFCFIGSALVFWYPVIRPYPSRPSWPLWLLIPYLILADIQNTILSAVLTLSDNPLYSDYVKAPRVGGFSPLDDQVAAGVLMWVPGSLVYLVPLFVIAVRLLFGDAKTSQPHPRAPKLASKTVPAGLMLPIVAQPACRAAPSAFDALRIPFLGRFLRWRHARLSMQIPLVLLALAVVYDGFCGPAVAPMNLAGVLPWIHWRGLVILGLLVVGNVFCMACPFTLPRTIARRWLPQAWNWPHWLRNKWLAAVLLGLFLWAYEALALWDRPTATAWIAIAYFLAAFVVDSVFRGAAFCKYVCPIGQFNFVQSLVSPLEVRVREPVVCATCQTRECIRGGGGHSGCALELFQPRKVSNLDCTFCLDCVHACPHENVGILAATPGHALWHGAFQSGVGWLGRRPDLAALVVLLVFGAFANAAGMVGPVLDWRDRWSSLLQQRSPLLATTLFYVSALVLLPVLLLGASATVSRWLGQLTLSTSEVAIRFSYALVPLGFSMWLAHYSFHFFGGSNAIIPAAQRFAQDLGWTFLGKPEWTRACCRPAADWLPRLEIVFLDLGLLLSLYCVYRISTNHCARPLRALLALAPWAFLLLLMFALGVWIILQPMQMRGTLPMAR